MNTAPPKIKQPSPVRGWWGRFLFATEFEIETPIPPPVLIERLRGLDPYPKIEATLKPLIVRTTSIEDGSRYSFEVFQRRNNMNGKRIPLYASLVKMQGVILHSEGYDRTIVRGDIRAGWLYALFVVLSPLIALMIFIIYLPTSISLTHIFMLDFVLLGGWILSKIDDRPKILYRKIGKTLSQLAGEDRTVIFTLMIFVYLLLSLYSRDVGALFAIVLLLVFSWITIVDVHSYYRALYEQIVTMMITPDSVTDDPSPQSNTLAQQSRETE